MPGTGIRYNALYYALSGTDIRCATRCPVLTYGLRPLPVPGMRGWVERPKEVLMKGRNEKGEEIAVKLGGLPARVAQHEFDHIDGVLFPSRVPGQQFLVPQASIDGRAGWAEGWPSVGSHQTALGQLQDVP